MTSTSATGSLHLGFLTVLHEAGGYLGGYLVTNLWGRPLEFRLSTAVQPNKVQQILYGGSLQSYICADLIGKTLLERTSTAAQLVLTDREPTLDLRLLVNLPVIWSARRDDPVATALAAQGAEVAPANDHHGPLLRHPRHPEDAARVRDILCQLDGNLDLAEPFERIREALAEARKMGVTSRNAA